LACPAGCGFTTVPEEARRSSPETFLAQATRSMTAAVRFHNPAAGWFGLANARAAIPIEAERQRRRSLLPAFAGGRAAA
jgi:hypothetical protein